MAPVYKLSASSIKGRTNYGSMLAGNNAYAPSVSVDILVVGGGGTGGPWNPSGGGLMYRGSGGGAGGLIYISSFPITGNVSYTTTVGAGGAGSSGTLQNRGSDSVFTGNGRTLTALGGGGGGYSDSTNNGQTGGSGGGQWYPGYTGASATQPANTNDGVQTWNGTGFGNKGGDSGNAQPYGSGGGGEIGRAHV